MHVPDVQVTCIRCGVTRQCILSLAAKVSSVQGSCPCNLICNPPLMTIALAGVRGSDGVMYGQGDYEEAMSLFSRAAAGARQALSADNILSPSMRAEPSPWALREALTSACSGAGQASLAQKQWEAAEDPLSEVSPGCLPCNHPVHSHCGPFAFHAKGCRAVSSSLWQHTPLMPLHYCPAVRHDNALLRGTLPHRLIWSKPSHETQQPTHAGSDRG